MTIGFGSLELSGGLSIRGYVIGHSKPTDDTKTKRSLFGQRNIKLPRSIPGWPRDIQGHRERVALPESAGDLLAANAHAPFRVPLVARGFKKRFVCRALGPTWGSV